MSRHDRDEPARRVRIPADVDRDDTILAGLSARQLALLAVPAVVLWLSYAATRTVVPLPVFAVLAFPVGAVAVTIALGRRDGIGMDRFALAALRHLRAPRRLVPTDGPLPELPEVVRHLDSDALPAPLRLPFQDVDTDGVLDLGTDGSAVLCRASAVSFTLRTPTEQAGMVAAFGRYLNSLTTPVQLLVRAEPVDLTPASTRLHRAAGGLPHPALEAAALAHAEFLADLAERRTLLRRDVLLVLRDRTATVDVATTLRRRADDASTALAAAGVTLRQLDESAASRILAGAVDPWAPPRPAGSSAPGMVITGSPA